MAGTSPGARTEDEGTTPSSGGRRARTAVRLTPRQVNLALEVLIVTAILSGLLSWSVTDRWSGTATFVHGASGLALLLLLPAKLRGSVRTGFRRGRATRWVSSAFGVLVLATVALGVAHATGLWFGVGQWSALWTHELLGFVLIPFLLWHVASRPVRPSSRDLGRRAFLRFGAVAGTAAVLHPTQRLVSGAVGLAGGDRRGTGSHEVASFDPDRMPTVIWLNDRSPDDVDPTDWILLVDDLAIAIDDLVSRAEPLVATLDCTGGWWSEQAWDAVPLSTLFADVRGRSVRVESVTGYVRRFPVTDLSRLFLAVGYGGQPLRRGHGAPVRLVVPGRRGPEWVKWVTRVDLDDRPWWLQPPLPLS